MNPKINPLAPCIIKHPSTVHLIRDSFYLRNVTKIKWSNTYILQDFLIFRFHIQLSFSQIRQQPISEPANKVAGRYCYRPQTKFAKVMFLQVCVCPWGVMLGCRGVLLPGGGCQGWHAWLWGCVHDCGGVVHDCQGAYVVVQGHAWLQGAGMYGCRGAWMVVGGMSVCQGGMHGCRGCVWLWGACVVVGVCV